MRGEEKILVVYASAGAGHRRAAEAIYKYLTINYQLSTINLIDALDYTNPLFKFVYSQGYYFLVKYLPRVWGFIYSLTRCPSLYRLVRKLRYLVNRLNTSGLIHYLKKTNPPLVISTHFLPNEVISYLKKKNQTKLRLVSVITDFYPHPFWINDGVDKYLVGLEETKDELLNLGVRPEKIEVTGIPVDPKFMQEMDKNLLCQKMSLKKDIFTVLIVSGTSGIGPIRRIVKQLLDEIQVLVVCGRNNRLYSQLKNFNNELLKVYGLVDNMEELMSISALVVTKPGGLTISEALAKELPMLFFYPIPGQEERNCRILIKRGVGVKVDDLEKVKDLVLSLRDSSKINILKQNLENIPKLNILNILNILTTS